MYSINNIPLSNFGITPGRIEGSNIAVSGMLDMPARIGKTFHDWTGEQGVEPYVLENEIRHGGRNIQLAVYLAGEDKATAFSMLKNFYAEIGNYRDLVPLVTPYGTFQVYVKEKIRTNHLQIGWNSLNIEFREPVVSNPGVVPAGSETQKPHIDGVALDSLNMFLSGFKDHLNRAKIKEQEFTAYENEGYQVTPAEALEYEMELVAYAGSFAELKTNVQILQKILSSPGMRTIKADAHTREVFNVNGFEVSNLKIAANYAVCRITVPVMTSKAGAPVETTPLLFNDSSQMASTLNELINIRI